MILLHADGTHETVTIRGTNTKRGGLPVVIMFGAAYVVSSLKSGHCIDGLHHRCTYTPCPCDCHEVAA